MSEPIRNNKQALLAVSVSVLAIVGIVSALFKSQPPLPKQPPSFRDKPLGVESIDTMKDSRDMARAELNDPSYGAVISKEMALIASAGADYVAIDVPYDPEFTPIMERWVSAARTQGLHVWFRGNLSGWEGWFGYKKIGREDHLKGVESFILDNPALFQDGDIFTGCPECENGGTGDPRQDPGDVASYRAFLINEYDVWSRDFQKIGKKVSLWDSMNADVARLVMDRATASALGGTVVIDDYTSSPEQLGNDIASIHAASGAKIVLGEFGAPIPNLNGSMDYSEQADFITNLMAELYSHADIVAGVNYWDLRWGSTALLADDMTPKPAYRVVQSFYSGDPVDGTVTDDIGDPVSSQALSASMSYSGPVSSVSYAFRTDQYGDYRIFMPQGLNGATSTVTVSDPSGGYSTSTVALSDGRTGIILSPTHPAWPYNAKKFFHAY